MAVREKDYSEETAREIDIVVRRLIEEAYARAKEILTGRAAELESGVKLLLERETITPEDFPAIASAHHPGSIAAARS